jgi:hypothetical protein
VTGVRGGTPSELLQLIVGALETQVVPADANPRARATLLLAVGLLDNLAQRIEEAPGLRTARDEGVDRLVAAMPRALAENLLESGGDFSTRVRERRLANGFAALRDSAGLLNSLSVQMWLSICRDEFVRCNNAELQRLRPTRYLRSQH